MAVSHLLLLTALLAAAEPGAASETPPPSPAAAIPAARTASFGLPQVVDEARALAAAPYSPPPADLPPYYANLTYDQYRDIRYNKAEALWRADNSPIEIEFFYPGGTGRRPATVYQVVDGEAKPLTFRRESFNYGPLVPVFPEGTPLPSGFGGFRAHSNFDKSSYKDEFVVFQGASYFRAVARGQIYGISARGLAINPGRTEPEEFPVFEKFWLERPAANSTALTVYALLNGPSVAGAYEFHVSPGNETITDVTAVLFFRREVSLVGIAPMSSMFWFGDNTRPRPDDWRAAVHDSDGLLVANQDGDWNWQPLDPTGKVRQSSFHETKLAGFGLLQRERRYEGYRDLEALYEKRPSLWVEPVGDWGAGNVRLIELPAGKEFYDNIVACWEPATAPVPGQPVTWRYRLHWVNVPEEPASLCQITSTLRGREINDDGVEFVIDFAQPAGRPSTVLPELDASAGEGALLRYRQIMPNPNTGGWRAVLHVRFKPGSDSSRLTCQLYRNGSPISEKWNYFWTAP